MTSKPSNRTSGAVSFRLRRVEYLLPLALAALTGWTAVVLFPTSGVAWGAVAFAVCLGGWSRAYPARSPALLAARAALLLVAASALHLDPMLDGPAGAFMFWPVAVAVGYALLLERPWALGLAALALLEFAVVLALQPQQESARHVMVSGGLLVVFTALALAFARSMQRSEAEVEASLSDAQTGLYNAAGLFAHGEELYRNSLREKQAISLVLLQFQDMRDVSRILGRTAARRMFLDAVQALAKTVRGQAIAARTGREEFALLLPGTTTEQAKSLLEAQLGQPPQVSGEVRGHKVQILLDSAVLSARDRSPTLDVLYDQVRSRLDRKRRQLLQPKPAPRATTATVRGKAPLLDDDHDLARSQGPDTDVGPLSQLEFNPTLPMPETGIPLPPAKPRPHRG